MEIMEQEIVRLGGAWHYRLQEKLACSTFGEVWRAQWMQTGKMVALKRLNRALGVNLTAEMNLLRQESLQRELAVYQSLGENLHFARLLHHGEADGGAVMILDLLDGNLETQVRAYAAPLAPLQALEWLRQVATGLAWMHAHGLCHLDLKPQNLLLSRKINKMPLVLKIADFGLALDCSAGPAQHRIPGSPGWMAPEQARSWRNDVRIGDIYCSDARADVYALGLLLFYLLTGHKTSFSVALADGLKSGDSGKLSSVFSGFSQGGLSEQDQERLRSVLCGDLNNGVQNDRKIQGDATWVPIVGGQGQWHENSMHTALCYLLMHLLSFEASRRPQNAGQVLCEISRLQIPW